MPEVLRLRLELIFFGNGADHLAGHPCSDDTGGNVMSDDASVDFFSGKYKYELVRKEKEAKKKQRTIEVKEVRLSPNIDVNDLNTKCNSARKFIEKGNKVKVSLRFRGREMAHIDSSKHILEDFAEKLSDIAVVDKAPKLEGRSMTMFLTEKR